MARLLSAPIRSAVSIEDALVATLRDWARTPFHPIKANCAVSVLDYAEMVTGRGAEPDPRDRFAAVCALRSTSVLVDLSHAVMAGLGWDIVPDEGRGDVGLVPLPDGLTACICAGPQDGMSSPWWVARRPDGFVSQRVRAQVVWRAPCLRR